MVYLILRIEQCEKILVDTKGTTLRNLVCIDVNHFMNENTFENNVKDYFIGSLEYLFVSVGIGVALIGIKRKAALIDGLQIFLKALSRLTNFVVGLTPIGVFAIEYGGIVFPLLHRGIVLFNGLNQVVAINTQLIGEFFNGIDNFFANPLENFSAPSISAVNGFF